MHLSGKDIANENVFNNVLKIVDYQFAWTWKF